jgi:hypothetical protein
MEPDPAKRLRTNVMLPVLLEGDFIYPVDKDADPFVRTVRDELLSGEAGASEELVLHLLQRQRILAIVVEFSELSQETKSSIRPGSLDFPANALVITSQFEEALGGVRKSVIQATT